LGEIGDDLLLILQDRLLVPDDLHLVADDRPEALLIVEDLVLVRDDRAVGRDDLLLIPDRGMRHEHAPSMRSVIDGDEIDLRRRTLNGRRTRTASGGGLGRYRPSATRWQNRGR